MTPLDLVIRRRRSARAAAVTLALLGPVALVAGTTGSASAAYDPGPPFVSRPLPATASDGVVSGRVTKPSAEFRASCGTPVVAAHPGVARLTSTPWAGEHHVKITTQGGVRTEYGYLASASVADGQLIQAGQEIGRVGAEGKATRCGMRMRVVAQGRRVDPVDWLDRRVGKPVDSSGLFKDDGFTLGSFNVLGASHTAKGGNKAKWPDYHVRLPKAIDALESAGADVVGLQEFQRKQRALFKELTERRWGIFPKGTKADPENSIVWRKSQFRRLEGATFPVPYFEGRIRQMPYVLLQDKQTGRTAYVINVHNPATTPSHPGSAKWRVEALKRERQLVIDLRASGRPVFLTGDFNDREKAFCPLTEGKLMISPNSIPSFDCAMPKYYWVDWIFAAGQARFTTLSVDTSMKPKQITDHPLVLARTHLAD
ncbi:peptidoglycan DD-metalloendopeptidase family protein [Nocardioides donggukensis]|uniref:Peptidoglycan DD-metalloendopeptidase family protein n=1 Tax=Nocardioides donggukensis TaxID=2774019 RepID=A0A927K1Y8_9ACTN|nr:peptidoglycan DD-metalloendopeptidase family protein [Nocardioides donggukensis]MBD8868207.1 peptidoglycan DD-metalloendopeptidase family protein [Nocardioides donggukensis]